MEEIFIHEDTVSKEMQELFLRGLRGFQERELVGGE
jgi:hypothetical protein